MDNFDNDELFALARRDLDAGRLEEALRKLKQVIAGKDAMVEALPFAARVYGQLRLIEKARTCYQRYLEAKPGALPESFELGITYFEGGDGKEARQIWDKVLSAAPTHPPTLFYSGLLAVREGRVPDARRNLDVLFKSTPADNLYVTRGRELLEEIDKAPAAPAVAGRPEVPQAAPKPGH